MQSLEYQLQTKEMALNSLFETIHAINDNASEDHLFKIYKFTLMSHQGIRNMVLYLLNDNNQWECKVKHGTKQDFLNIDLPESILNITEVSGKAVLENILGFDEFDTVIPVSHKSTMLGYAFFKTANSNAKAVDLDFVEALSNIIVVAIENKKLARKQQRQEAFRRQMDIARDVQALLFPKKLPYTDKIKVVANYMPHHSVGGDYYDFLEINPDKFLICIADVSGKGIPAAILMSNFQAALRTLVRRQVPLREIVEELNHLILQNARGENFITAFFVEYQFKLKSMTYINAGHNAPFMFTPHDSQAHYLHEGTTILGAFETLPFLNISTINNLHSFLLFCFTDGFTEAANEKGEELGVTQMSDFVLKNKHLDQKELHKALLQFLHRFQGNNDYSDDITLLSCAVKNWKEM